MKELLHTKAIPFVGTVVLLAGLSAVAWVWPQPLILAKIRIAKAVGVPIPVGWSELASHSAMFDGQVVRFISKVSVDQNGITLLNDTSGLKAEELIDGTTDPQRTEKATVDWIDQLRVQNKVPPIYLVSSATFTGTFRTVGPGCYIPRNRLEISKTTNRGGTTTMVIPAP